MVAAWDLAAAEPPWDSEVSILAHVAAHLDPSGRGLLEGGDDLPDEPDDGGVRWAAGARDGVSSHHGSGGHEQSRARMIARALRVVLEDASPVKLKRLYEQLLQGGALEYIDPLLDLLAEEQGLDGDRLEELALWLVRASPDREPVKFAMAILGLLGGPEHHPLFLTLGRHQEFTLYAAVALSNDSEGNAEANVFELARQVDGWGRIHLVERLAATDDPTIKAWMLREGYRNSVMYEYLAYTCTTVGDLRGALEAGEVDPDLLASAGELIQALIVGGPAQDIDDYDDGAAVVERYLHHLGPHPEQPEQLIVVDHILRFLDQEAGWSERAQRGWTPELRQRLRARAGAIAPAGRASEDGS